MIVYIFFIGILLLYLAFKLGHKPISRILQRTNGYTDTIDAIASLFLLILSIFTFIIGFTK